MLTTLDLVEVFEGVVHGNQEEIASDLTIADLVAIRTGAPTLAEREDGMYLGAIRL